MLKDIFNIDSFQSFFEKGSWFSINENLQSVLNALLNIVFGIIKYFVLALDYVIEKLFNLNLLEGVLPELFSTANTIYTKLFSLLGILLFTFVIIISIKDFYEKGFTKALIRFGVFILIYFGSLTFFSGGSTKVQEINALSQNVQGQLVNLTSGSLNKNQQSSSDKLLTQSVSDGTTNIRNMIFDEFILKPYALLNFGKTDLTKTEFENYLIKQTENFDEKKSNQIKEKIKVDSEQNSYLTSDRMTEKVVVLINTLIMIIVIGIAVLIIGLSNIIIQLLIYGVIFLLPSLLFLALIPNMHHLLKNGFILLGTLFATKIGIGFSFGLLFSILNIIDSFFVVTNIISMLVGLFIKVLLGIFIWKNKTKIVKALTKGKAELADIKFNPLHTKNNTRTTYQDKDMPSNKDNYSELPLHQDSESSHSVQKNNFQSDVTDNILVQSSRHTSMSQSSLNNENKPFFDEFTSKQNNSIDSLPLEELKASNNEVNPPLTYHYEFKSPEPNDRQSEGINSTNFLPPENDKEIILKPNPSYPTIVTTDESISLEKEINSLRKNSSFEIFNTEDDAYEVS